MKVYAEDTAKVQAYNKTKDFKSGIVACCTCHTTIPMTGAHHVVFGFYQCHNCGERAAMEQDSMMRGVCPRCDAHLDDTDHHASDAWNSTCIKCGFSISYHLPQDVKRVKRYKSKAQRWVVEET